MAPVVKYITVYPVKSLDGVTVQKAQIGTGGSLIHDREYAIFDADGKYVNGKKNALVHLLRSQVDFENQIISFKHEMASAWNQFRFAEDKTTINEFLSGFFGMPVSLQQHTDGGFLDVPVKSGVTVLSTASLKQVGNWFSDMPLEETRKRFRATIEIDNVPAFWEDHLFNGEESAIEFKIGDATFLGLAPRARCVVPTRHPQTGDLIHGFQKTFVTKREAKLPDWSNLKEYDHSYYLSVDCYIPPTEFGKWIEVGEELEIVGKKRFADLFIQ